MKLLSLIKEYSDVDPVILGSYQDADEFFLINDGDRDLIPITIPLPSPPPLHEIDGFGLPAKQQKYHHPVMPRRLRELETNKKFETLDELWKFIDDNRDKYSEEIEWMRLQWQRRLNGYWLFINGKPTYMDGWQYFYDGFWPNEKGLPMYTDRDRRWFIAVRHVATDTKTFANIDKDGWAIREADGSYAIVETGGRVHLGVNYPKYRREGATYRCECINYEIISRTKNAMGGIQSMNEDKAKRAFHKQLISPWKKLPFFFKPNYEGSTDPKTIISFNPPAVRLSSKGSRVISNVGLESMISYEVADKGAYDGDQLLFHHDDEVGKLDNVDCWERHLIVKECLVVGSDIIGLTIKTSTVGQMEKGPGRRFEHQCDLSHYHQRNLNGQTVSGLINLFIPSRDGLFGFIGPYGESVIDTPTPEQAQFIHKKIGAREYLENRKRAYREKKDLVGLSEITRQYPESWRDCWKASQKESGFDIQKLEDRIDERKAEKHKGVIQGNFVWKDGKKDGKVIFIENPMGKFRISQQFSDAEANKKVWDNYNQSWVPMNTSFGVAGGDPFKFKDVDSGRKSKGGGAVVRKGKIKDGDFAMKRRFVCTYSNRTENKYEYGEDMLMMCVYYGIKMFPEINVEFLWEYFEQRRYALFLLYRLDPKTMRPRNTPGATTLDKIKQDIFIEYMTWISQECDEELHTELLIECADIDGPDDMKNFDLFTAGGYALLGTNAIYDEVEEFDQEQKDLSRYIRVRKYPRYGA